MIKDIILAIQHFFAMYAGAISVPIIVGKTLSLSSTDIMHLISADLITSGIATLLYLFRFKHLGIGLPVVLGASFNSVAAFIAIGTSSGLPFVYGAIIVSGLFIMIAAPLIAKIGKMFPTVILGVVVTIIGLSLLPIAFGKLGGDIGTISYGSKSNLLLALCTIIFIVLWNNYTKGFLKSTGLLIAIIVFSIIGHFIFQITTPSPLENTQLFSIPTFFYFGTPSFDLISIITMIIIMLITSVESLGGLLTLSHICEKPLTTKDISNSFRSEGLATIIGGFFNAFTYSNFAQNIALVSFTGVKRIRVIVFTACILIILGFLPKIGSLSLLIPSSVLGAVLLVMFGIIATNGLKILSSLDFKKDSNIWTIALSLGTGLGTIVQPMLLSNSFPSLAPFLSNPIIMSSCVGMLTFSMMNKMKKKN